MDLSSEFNKDDKISEFMLKNEFAKQLLEAQLSVLIKEFEYKNHYNPIEHVKSRIKSDESIRDKLKRKGYEYSLENLKSHVHDIVGIRIVCSFLSDVYEIVDLIKNSGQFEIVAEKDYIETPKETEYIEAEIQVRTIAMDFWASIDHKIHYKFLETPKDVQNDLYACSLAIKALDNRMNQLNEIVHKYD